MFGRKRSNVERQARAHELEPGTRRLRIVFVGQVQGVGFRWTAQIKARDAGATGWVRNEGDGSVTMELQGTDEQIGRFFTLFDRSYARYPIDYVIDSKEEVPVDPTEDDFVVRFSSGAYGY